MGNTLATWEEPPNILDEVSEASAVAIHEPVLTRTLLSILFVSFVLNVCCIWWGLPSTIGWAPDELTPSLVIEAIEKRFSGNWHSQYPPFHYYLLALAYLPFLFLQRLLELPSFEVSLLFYVGRSLSLVMATGVLYVMYLTGRELGWRLKSLLALPIIAFSPVFVYYAKMANVDVPVLFWLSCSLLFYLKAIKHHQLRDYLLLATSAAFAVCTKDQAYAFYLLMPFVLVPSLHAYRKRQQRDVSVIGTISNYRNVLSVVVGGSLFVLIHNILFGSRVAERHFKLITRNASVQFSGELEGHLTWFRQTIEQMDFVLGFPLLVICLLAVFYAVLQKKRNFLLLSLLAPAVSYYVFFIATVGYTLDRLVLPLCLVLAFFGANLFGEALKSFSRFRAAYVVAVLAVFVFSFLRAVSLNVYLGLDSRYAAEDFIANRYGNKKIMGPVGIRKYLPRHAHLPRQYVPPIIGEFNSLKRKPDYIVVNHDYSRRWTPLTPQGVFIRALYDEKLGYKLVYTYEGKYEWLLVNKGSFYKRGIRRVFSNLEKIASEIRVYERIG